MRPVLSTPSHFTAGAVARILGLVAIGLPAIAVRDTNGLIVVLMFAVIWSVATLLNVVARIPVLLDLMLESTSVAFACGIGLDRTNVLHLSALAVTPFIGGLRLGIRGLVLTMMTQVLVLVSALVAYVGVPDDRLQGELFAAYVLALGLGLVGCLLRSTQASRDELRPYKDARVLLDQLLDLDDVLDGGLDARTLGARLLSRFQDEVPALELSLWSVADSETAPLVTGSFLEPGDHGASIDAPDVVVAAVAADEVVVVDQRFAVPLGSVTGRCVAVVGMVSPHLGLGRRAFAQRLSAAAKAVRPLTVQLDTALVFAEVNQAATRSERRRLAREMHDGVAQDIASMGYLVDALVDGPLPDDVRPQIELMRTTISRVVAEVRASVTALRTDVDAAESLGEAITGLARRLSDASGISIRCTVDERTARLRPEVEAELLRIAQEALTNAVKHAGATEIDVECRVDAPRARIVVRDNGRGLGPEREDSHGLTIMRERATLVGARLTIDSSQLGTVVHVSLGGRGAGARPIEGVHQR